MKTIVASTAGATIADATRCLDRSVSGRRQRRQQHGVSVGNRIGAMTVAFRVAFAAAVAAATFLSLLACGGSTDVRLAVVVTAFSPSSVTKTISPTAASPAARCRSSSSLFVSRAAPGEDSASSDNNNNFLLDEYRLSNGEILDPYDILKVPRNADVSEIKNAYRALSKRYHPDGRMQRGISSRDILPRYCDTEDDVREYWERIRLSYSILRDPRKRRRFDRHVFLSDPGDAVKRAAVDAAFSGIKGVGKGLWDAGAGLGKGLFGMAYETVKKATDEKKQEKEKRAPEKPISKAEPSAAAEEGEGNGSS